MAVLAFTTERLSLRPFSEADFPLVDRIYQNKAVMRYVTHLPPYQSKAEPMAYLQRVLTYQQNTKDGYGFWTMALRTSPEHPFGWLVIRDYDGNGAAEIGYLMEEMYWGNGYASEAVRFLMDYGFNTMGAQTLVGVTAPGNTASHHVLEKQGFTPTPEWEDGSEVLVFRKRNEAPA